MWGHSAQLKTTRAFKVPLSTHFFLDTAQLCVGPCRPRVPAARAQCGTRTALCFLLSNLNPSRVRASPSRVSNRACAVCCLDGVTCRWLSWWNGSTASSRRCRQNC